MKFFDYITRSFGFGPDVDSSDPVYADTVDLPLSEPKIAPANDEEISPVEFDTTMQDAIFKKIIEVFNESLPGFLSETVDKEAQLKYLRSCLDDGIKNYLISLNDAAKKFCDSQWKARQTDMAAEMDAIRLKADEVDRRSNEIQQKQLSADRQKRALSEKVHELESNLAKVISEREQFELENRSLLSRLKASAVHNEDIEKINAELIASRSELMKLREDPSLINQELEEKYKNEIKKLQEGIDALREQIKINDGVRDQLREKIKEKEKTLDERNKEIADLNILISEFEKATLRMEEAEKQMIAGKKIHAEEIAGKDAEIASLKETIAENIKRQAEREKTLRDEIDSLREENSLKVQVDFSEEVEVPDRLDAPEEEDIVVMLSDEDLDDFSASFEEKKQIEKENSENEIDFSAVLPERSKKSEKEFVFSELPEIEDENPVSEPASVKESKEQLRHNPKKKNSDKEQKKNPKYNQPSLF